MNGEIRRKLEMAARVRDFHQAHPFATAHETRVAARLEELVTRASELTRQQHRGLIAVHFSCSHRRKLRRLVRRLLLRHLARVAAVATNEEPGLALDFRLPREDVNAGTFRTVARSMAGAAQARRDLFLRHGMAPTLLDDLTGALDQYDEAVEQAYAGRRAHVGASADLDEVGREILRVADQLDGMNRYRFQHDAERLAAWESARNVVWPVSGRGETAA